MSHESFAIFQARVVCFIAHLITNIGLKEKSASANSIFIFPYGICYYAFRKK